MFYPLARMSEKSYEGGGFQLPPPPPIVRQRVKMFQKSIGYKASIGSSS